MPLALQLALRFLDEGRTQTGLILSGVTIGVAAYVFITATMIGVQANLIDKTLGSQPHLIVLQPDPDPRPVLDLEGSVALRAVSSAEPRQTPFDQWQQAARQVASTPGVVAVSPKITGSALARRGGGEQAVQVIGADPIQFSQIVDIPAHITQGDYRVQAEQAVIGARLAEDLGIATGSPLRIVSGPREFTLRVSGLFELGNETVDGQWVLTSLRTGQSILGRPGDVSAIDVKVDDLFAADDIADEVAARTSLRVDSWQSRNAALLTGLSAQDQSTTLIRVFTILAVAMGIAAVLAVTVVQRRGQIGILRAMGLSRAQILRVFLWQGALLGLGGAVVGTVIGAAFGSALGQVVPFDIVVDAKTALSALVISVGTGIGAALWPARSASSMDPAAAIRGDG